MKDWLHDNGYDWGEWPGPDAADVWDAELNSDMKPSITKDALNARQSAAIKTKDKRLLVLAGPGSGKTRVLTERILHLLKSGAAEPQDIMAVTFTNKAAREMRNRVRKEHPLSGMRIGTFHAISARLLRQDNVDQWLGYREGWEILDRDGSIKMLKDVYFVLDEWASEKTLAQCYLEISRLKNQMILPGQTPAASGGHLQRIYLCYQLALLAANLMDFSDLLLNAVLLLRNNERFRIEAQKRVKYLLVDEFQDINLLQYELVRLLAGHHQSVFVVGDEDQAIYSWRGADIGFIHQFRNDFKPQEYVLQQNYRSTQLILDTALSVIERNTHRTRKALFTERSAGKRVRLLEAVHDNAEAKAIVRVIALLRKEQGLSLKDFAIMYRDGWISSSIERELAREQIPYQVLKGIGFYSRREIRDMLAFLRLTVNPDDETSFSRIVNVPKRKLGKKRQGQFKSWREDNGLSLGVALTKLATGQATELNQKIRQRFTEFAMMVLRWGEIASSGDLAMLFDVIVEDTGYNSYIDSISKLEEEAGERRECLNVLRNQLEAAMQDEYSLSAMLDELALAGDVDSSKDDEDSIKLLTLHTAKGLEFPAVFIIGVEEGTLPNYRSISIEEERRLFYVGITRAMDDLTISFANWRGTGEREMSEFLAYFPLDKIDASEELLEIIAVRQRRAPSKNSTATQASAPGHAPIRPGGAVTASQVHYPGEDAGQDMKSKFKHGQRVRHPTNGEGYVFGTETMDFGEAVSVLFDTSGPRKLNANNIAPAGDRS